MQIMKKPVKITLFSMGGIATVALILAIVLGVRYLYINADSVLHDFCVWLARDVEQPEEKHGEFPFKLVYDNGRQSTYEEILVIEHTGVYYDTAKGAHNTWNMYFKHNEHKANLAFTRKFCLLDRDGVTIEFILGSPEYYFGLEESDLESKKYGFVAGDIIVREYAKEPYAISDDALYEKYGIKIIERWTSPPLAKAE